MRNEPVIHVDLDHPRVITGQGEPVFLAQGGHVKREVPELLAAARQRHLAVTIDLRAAVGEADRVIAAMADVVLQPD